MYVTDKRPDQMRWYLRPFFWLQRRRYGAPLVPALVWARVPALYVALAGFYAALDRRRSPLDPILRHGNRTHKCHDAEAGFIGEA